MPARAPSPIRDLDAKDTELARLAFQRDGRGFRIPMQPHNRRLYRCTRFIVRDDSKGDDIVQEAYVNAISNLAGFRGEYGLGTRLTGITLNEALGRVRRRRSTVKLATLDLADPGKAQIIVGFPLMTTSSASERATAQREMRRLIERAIDDLPELLRVVFVMCVIVDMSVEETAGFLDLRPVTVKYRLHRAQRLLRKALDAQLAPALTDAFPFDGTRCARMTDAILQRFGL
jgi:RNA polymerase sigma-70 factor (ECF subfamily)